MKNLIAVILLALCASVHAASVQFEGFIYDILPDASMCLSIPINMGDRFSAHVTYNPNTHLITHIVLTVGNQTVHLPADGSQFNFGCDYGVRFFRVSGGLYLAVELDAFHLRGEVPDCAIPPLDQFFLNEVTLCNNGIFGVLTEIPKVRP